MAGTEYISALEQARVPYAVRPFHLHDLLEKVSDLLVEVKAIEGPLRMTRYEFGEASEKEKAEQPDDVDVRLEGFLFVHRRRTGGV